jgi:hypothetical protein
MSPASWGFTRGSEKLRQRYVDRFGDLDTPISIVRSRHAPHVEIVDLHGVIPELLDLIEAS